MLIDEGHLRKIIREEIERVDRSKKNLIVQDDEMDELSGYDIEYNTLPEADDDFQKVRLARLRASGVPEDKAEKMATSKLKHRGKRPGHG
jgi:hypothetical protein